MRENARPSLARSLLGRDDLARVHDMQIDKPPGAVATPWHQDMSATPAVP